MAKLNSKKTEKLCIYKEKRLVGSTPDFWKKSSFFHYQTSSASCSFWPSSEVGSRSPFGVSKVEILSFSSIRRIPTDLSVEEETMRNLFCFKWASNPQSLNIWIEGLSSFMCSIGGTTETCFPLVISWFRWWSVMV